MTADVRALEILLKVGRLRLVVIRMKRFCEKRLPKASRTNDKRKARPTLLKRFNEACFVHVGKTIETDGAKSRIPVRNLFQRDVFSHTLLDHKFRNKATTRPILSCNNGCRCHQSLQINAITISTLSPTTFRAVIQKRPMRPFAPFSRRASALSSPRPSLARAHQAVLVIARATNVGFRRGA